MQFCGTGTGLDIIGSFLIQMIWLDYFQTLSDDQAFAWLCEYCKCEAPFIQKQVAWALASPAKQATVIVSPVPVLCIVLHYITAAAMVEMLGMSRFLHQCCLRTYLRPTHNTALFVPFPLASTKLTHSLLAVTADVGKTQHHFYNGGPTSPHNYRILTVLI